MANGHILATDLVRHAAYQRELLVLIHSLTEEGPDGIVRAALKRPLELDACIAFRRCHGLLVDPNVDPLIYLVGIHRATIRHPVLMRAAEKIPPDADAMRARGIINYSEHWLIRRGLGTDVDTEFNPAPLKRATPGKPGRKKMPWEVP
jgi:hypothetical protein